MALDSIANLTQTAPLGSPASDQARENLNNALPTSDAASAGKVGTAVRPEARVLMAQLPAVRTPTQLVNSWSNSIKPYTGLIPKPGAALPLPSTVPGAADVRYAPSYAAPITNAPSYAAPITTTGTAQPLATMFGRGSQVLSVPNVPTLGNAPSASTWSMAERAFTPQRVAQFAALTNDQKVVARTMLLAAMAGLQTTPGSANYIAPQDFAKVVALVLQSAQGFRQRPTVQPGVTALQPPAKPTTLSRVAASVVAEVPPSKPRTTNPVGSGSTVVAINPPANPTTGVTASDGTSTPQFAGNPLPAVITPAVWKQLTDGADGKTDPVLAQQMAQLLTDATDFAQQASTIDINRVGADGKTPAAAWAEYKAA